MSIELLQPFCANESDPREYLRAPFKVGAWVYGTNGHMAVRLKADDLPDIGEVTDPKATAPKLIGDLFLRALEKAGDKFMAMPDFPALVPCLYCTGQGRVWAMKCGDCEDGTFRHGSCWYDCKTCADESAGPGWVEVDEPGGIAVHRLCHYCDGLGFECGDGKRNPAIQIGDAHYNPAYLRLLAQLPKARICPGEPAVKPGAMPAAVLFDGGHGLLMPYRSYSAT